VSINNDSNNISHSLAMNLRELWNREMSEREAKTTFILIMVIAVSMIFGFNIYIELMSKTIGPQAIQNTVNAITDESNTDLEKLHICADWVNTEMTYNTEKWRTYPFWPLQYRRKSHPSPEFVFYSKTGGCEEHATLFKGLAEKTGIETRIVYNSGEDHTWTEVFVNGSWRHFDPMPSREKRFDDPGRYERPKEFGGAGKQISHVFYLVNDVPVSVTDHYTDTGILSVKVIKDGLPVEDAVVTIKSHFLMDHYSSYREPWFAMDKRTDREGFASFDLGMNNFTIEVRKGLLFGYKNDLEIEFFENQEIELSVELSDRQIILSRYELLMSFGMVLGTILGLLVTYLTYRK